LKQKTFSRLLKRPEGRAPGVDGRSPLKHFFTVSTLAEIEKAAAKLSPQQKQELMLFLGAQLRTESNGHAPRNLSSAERAADLKRWAASHERGPVCLIPPSDVTPSTTDGHVPRRHESLVATR